MNGPDETAAAVLHLLAALCSGYNLAHFLALVRQGMRARRLAAGTLALVSLALLSASVAALLAWRVDGVPASVTVALASSTLAASGAITVLILLRRR
ncbi:MAG: hypothetical protein FJX77_07875 [Armatimonadetes bacterium]|nr:hypothetical protein [Armatimonadota bacterium]